MIHICKYCAKERDLVPYLAKKQKYCSVRCQMNYEYDNGIRDKNKIVEKAQKIAHLKQKEDNWLNSKQSRDKLKQVMNTDEYRIKCREVKLKEKNPMYGKKSWNYTGLDVRTKYGISDRGFDWKRIKKMIKERDNYTCQKCGITEEDTMQYLQVHHLVKYSITKDNSPDNLITLCPKCHANSEPQFLRVKSITKVDKKETVYNISVKDDETYVAEDLIVHNCRSRVIYVPM